MRKHCQHIITTTKSKNIVQSMWSFSFISIAQTALGPQNLVTVHTYRSRVPGQLFSVKFHLSDKPTNDMSVCPFVCLYVASVRGVHPIKGMKRDASKKFKGMGIKIRYQPISTRNLVRWLSEKSLNYCHQMPHFQAKMHKNSIPGVCPFASQVELGTCTWNMSLAKTLGQIAHLASHISPKYLMG